MCVKLLEYNQCPKLIEACLLFINMISIDKDMQNMLFDSGATWFLIRFMLEYDITLDESGIETNKNENKQEILNDRARLATRCLSRLGGFYSNQDPSVMEYSTPRNDMVTDICKTLLTPYLTKMLGLQDCSILLKAINSNEMNPYLIWNNSTRAVLKGYCNKKCEEYKKMSNNLNQNGNDNDGSSLNVSINHNNQSDDIKMIENHKNVENFIYPQHEGLLVIEDVYVDVYNNQPNFAIKNPILFGKGLAEF